ncbi:hypothetical protein LCGC14_1924620 [marine sediment metagenome]|uniref:Uncharacterized protein n=1 Tax=marine sediment metagenome TaxID=412755 RepID=A0A0F9FPN0_9ZZZZ
MPVTDFDRENLDHILRDPEANWFTVQLLRLICKADADNRRLIRKGFPEEVDLIEQRLGRDSTG